MNKTDISLRREIYKSDAWRIIDWLNDEKVIQYLNEHQNVKNNIKRIINRINMPILTHLFNKNGCFFMITINSKGSIGFLRLVPKKSCAEMVIVIGDRNEWGKGFGSNAIYEGLKHAFFSWRVDEVIAKINYNNHRSRRVFKKVGFTKDCDLPKEIQYSISMDEFLAMVS